MGNRPALHTTAWLWVIVTVLSTAMVRADEIPALHTDWQYMGYDGVNFRACVSSDSAAATVTIAADEPGACSATFNSWTSTWPNTVGMTDYREYCPPAGVPYVWGYIHREIRNFSFDYQTNCSDPVIHSGDHVERQFFYYCPAGYTIWTPDNITPYCYRDPTTASPPKQPTCLPCVGNGLPSGDGSLNVGNPINIAGAFKYQRERDYTGAGPMPLLFERHYRGGTWRTTYSRSLTVIPLGPGSPTHIIPYLILQVVRDDGQVFSFDNFQGTGSAWEGDADVTLKVSTQFDGAGNVLSSTVTTENDSTETYNAAGELLSIKNRAGVTLSLSYDTSWRLSSISDPFGHALTLGYNAANQLATMTDPAGGVFQYGYDVTGNLTTVTDPALNVRTYVYNESANTSGASIPNALTGIIDESSSRFATFQYDAGGRPISSQHAGGAGLTTVAYNADGSATVTDELGSARTYAFKNVLYVAHIASITGPPCSDCGLAASYTYDSNGNLATRTDFKGVATGYSYSSDGRNLETQRTEAQGHAVSKTTTTQWHATYRLPTQITVSGFNETAFGYDSSGNLLTKTFTDTTVTPNVSRTWTYTYDGYGRVQTADGPRTDVSDVTTYTYYTCSAGFQCGLLHTITDALGRVTTYNTYDAHGRPLTITDPNGMLTTLTYDSRMRLTSRQFGTETTSLSYYPTGLLKQVTLPDGSYVLYSYDGAHRLTQVSDGIGDSIQYTLDAKGNRTSEKTYDGSNSLHRTHSRVYNALNQLYQDINAAADPSVTTTFAYDLNGNQTSVSAPLNRNTISAYDAINRPNQVTDAAGGVTMIVYDALDDVTSVTDPRSLTTNYKYNGLGDLTQLTGPDTGQSTNTYDSAGNLKTHADARGATATYTYDALNRLTQIAYSDQTIAFGYDSGSNAVGRLTSLSDASGSTVWTYETDGQVASKTQTLGTTIKTVGYGYNTAGQLTSLTTPSGQGVAYGYTNNQVTSISVNGTPLLSGVLYEPFGPAQEWNWGNGTLAVRSYDGDGNVTQVDSAGLKTYTYDSASRIMSIVDADNPALSAQYGYDDLDRLLQYGATAPGTTSLSVSTTSIIAGQPLSVTANNLPGGSGYWLALASTNAPATSYSQWIAVPSSGTSFTWNLAAPSIAGGYEVRLFSGAFQRVVTSSAITVNAASPPPQATLSADSQSVAPTTSATAQLVSGAGGPSDWLALAQVGAPDTSYITWIYVGSGVTTRNWTVAMPSTPGSYEFRLFLNNGYTRAATSPPVSVTSTPPVGGSGGNGYYAYDPNGNRLLGDGATETISGTSNRLSSISGAVNRAYGYDAAGNTISYGNTTLSYNAAGRMISSASSTSGTTTYAVNGLGQRVKKANSGSNTYFVYDEEGHLLGEYDTGGNLIQETVWLNDIPVATLRPNGAGGITVFYVHSDHLNTPRRISRPADNVVVWRWDSDPFGTTSPNSNPSGVGTFLYNLRFPGQYYDAETGLFYNYFRDYDPTIARYVESDPIGLAGKSLSTYTYTGNSPVDITDRFGLAPPGRTAPSVLPPGVFEFPTPGSPSNQAWSKSALPQIEDDINAVADWLYNLCHDQCPELAAKIKASVGELRARYVAALIDQYDLYRNAPLGPKMTWESHKLQYEQRQLNLQRLIEGARAQGCAIDPEADTWAAKPFPASPVR